MIQLPAFPSVFLVWWRTATAVTRLILRYATLLLDGCARRQRELLQVAAGRRSLKAEGSATFASGQWQELRVGATGRQFRGFLNGGVVQPADDLYMAGRPGLWTTAESVTCFQDVQLIVP